jgi:hypothetical protein
MLQTNYEDKALQIRWKTNNTDRPQVASTCFNLPNHITGFRRD